MSLDLRRGSLTLSALARGLPLLGLAALFLYYPLSYEPWAQTYRDDHVVPALGLANEKFFSPGVLVMPDVVLGVILACAFWYRRGALTARWPAILVWVAAALTVAGGLVSLTVSSFVGVSSAGLVARVGVLVLTLALLTKPLTSNFVRVCCYAALAGTAIICARGALAFVSTFGFPPLSVLPFLRSDPRYVAYTSVTYGFPSNTVDLLVLTVPMAAVLLVADRIRPPARLFVLCCLIVMVTNLFIAFQRWAWFCMAVDGALIALYWLRFRASGLGARAKAASALGFAGVGLLVLATIASQAGYFAQVLDPAEASSIGTRAMTWREGIDAIVANPAGYGLGTANTLARLTTSSSHNLLIDIGVEGGVLALAGASIWVCLHLWLLARVLLSTDDVLSFALLLGAFSFVLFGVFFNSLLYLSGNAVWFAYWWLFPAIAIARQFGRQPAVASSSKKRESGIARRPH